MKRRLCNSSLCPFHVSVADDLNRMMHISNGCSPRVSGHGMIAPAAMNRHGRVSATTSRPAYFFRSSMSDLIYFSRRHEKRYHCCSSLIAMSVITEPKLFGKWTYEDVQCSDFSLKVCYRIKAIIYVFLGLHRFQELGCRVPAPHCWSLSEEAFPKGHLPHRRETC